MSLATRRETIRPSFLPLVLGALLLLSAGQAAGSVFFLDLSRSANRGFADDVAEDGAGGWTDQGPAGDLHDFPVGDQEFLGVPFHVVDPATHDGRSVVALKGRARPAWPLAATLDAGGRKALWIYFLHTCAWAGTDKTRPFARYVVRYSDGREAPIPLRVGVEVGGWWGPGSCEDALTAWSARRKAAAVGVQLYAWRNPFPEGEIASITFESLDRLPVPILLAVTLSTEKIGVERPVETPVAPEGAAWPPFPAEVSAPPFKTATGTGIPRPLQILDGRFVDPGGKRVRLLGAALPDGALQWDAKLRKMAAERLAASGFNLVRLKAGAADGEGVALWCEDLSRAGLALELEAPALSDAFWTAPGGGEKAALKDRACLALVCVGASTSAEALEARDRLRALGFEGPMCALPARGSPEGETVSASLDFVEAAFAWDEPRTDENGHLHFGGEALLSSPEACPLAEAASRRIAAKPFMAWAGEAWPSPWAAEGSVLAYVTAAFQDWDGLGLSAPTGFWGDASFRASPVECLQAALSFLYLRGDLPPAREEGDLGPRWREEVEKDGLAWWAHRLVSGDRTRVPASKTDPVLKKVVADHLRWEWQGNIGVLRVGTPRSQVLAGFLSHRTLSNNAWTVETPNRFSAFVLTSLTKDPTAFSTRLLLAAAARYEAGDAAYNAGRTVLLSPGTDAVRAEPLTATLSLQRAKVEPTLKCSAYGADGKCLSHPPVAWRGRSASFKWPSGASWVVLESASPGMK